MRLGGRGDTLVVEDSTLRYNPPNPPSLSPRPQGDSVPAELFLRLQQVSQIVRPTATLPITRPARLITAGDLKEIFSTGPNPGWGEFKRRYPGHSGWLRFTPVAFTADSLNAMVYYEYHCGSLCGGGNAVWMVRSPNARAWRIHRVMTLWIS
jgi:hypothetical protein